MLFYGHRRVLLQSRTTKMDPVQLRGGKRRSRHNSSGPAPASDETDPARLARAGRPLDGFSTPSRDLFRQIGGVFRA
jgi:hypothetical protein